MKEFFQACEKISVLIVGDLMLDRYLFGKVSRISPEAPVPVVDINHEENRLGGAANVALNIHALGAKPILCGVTGIDKDGETMKSLMEGLDFQTDHIYSLESRRTTVKVRVIGNHQQVLRVDKEDRIALPEELQSQILGDLSEKMSNYQMIIFQDYDKYMLSPRFIHQLTEFAQQANIPVAVDPKFAHFKEYQGCTLFKPNLKELNEGMGTRLENTDLEGILAAVIRLRQSMAHTYTLVTLSENGMLWIDEKEQYTHIPAHYRNIVDVSGAGDTVISVAALGIASGMDPLQAAKIANLAGGLVCEKVGVVPIEREDLKREATKLH